MTGLFTDSCSLANLTKQIWLTHIVTHRSLWSKLAGDVIVQETINYTTLFTNLNKATWSDFTDQV